MSTAYDLLDRIHEHVNGGNMVSIQLGKPQFGRVPSMHIYRVDGTRLIDLSDVTLHDAHLKGMPAEYVTFWTKT